MRCRGCDQRILWAVTEKGRRTPLDPNPVPNGNIVVVEGERLLAIVLTQDEIADLEANHPERPRFRSHFVTCPDRDEFRRRSEVAV